MCHEVVNAKIGSFDRSVWSHCLFWTPQRKFDRKTSLPWGLHPGPPPETAPTESDSAHFHTEEPLHVGGHKKGQPLMCGFTCWALFSSQSRLQHPMISAAGSAKNPARRHELSLWRTRFFPQVMHNVWMWGAGTLGMLGEIQLSSQRAFEDFVDLLCRYLPSSLPSKAQRQQREAHKSAIDSGQTPEWRLSLTSVSWRRQSWTKRTVLVCLQDLKVSLVFAKDQNLRS